LDIIHEWVNDLRADKGTDWAIGYFIVDVSRFGDVHSHASNQNGPHIWTANNREAKTYLHETGHAWGALDEYVDGSTPTALMGYAQEVNANSQTNDGTGYFGGAGEGIDAVMIHGMYAQASPWTRGAWGIWDRDGHRRGQQDRLRQSEKRRGQRVVQIVGCHHVRAFGPDTQCWEERRGCAPDVERRRGVRVLRVPEPKSQFLIAGPVHELTNLGADS
jgi:hypothetical protein